MEMGAVKAIVFIISCNSILSTTGDSSDDLVVQLSTGTVKGEVLKGETGNEFYSFRKIPYAEPPLGDLRFKSPVPKKPWDDILDATKDGPSCAQLNFFTLDYEGDEDCLYLNVYTPKLPNKKDLKMNVVYLIPGGGFLAMAGTSSYIGPERFPLQDDVILVTVTYRVNVFGFLSTNDSASPGNYGLLDQVEGLKWVKNNIHHFGGDPKKVTIMGESAGAASVIYQMLSPLSKGRNATVDFVDKEINDDLRITVDTLPNVDNKLKLVREKYFGDLKSYKDAEVFKHLGPTLTDGMFRIPALYTAKEMRKSGTKVYLYQYDYEAPFSSSQFTKRPATYGVVHMDDLFMFFSGVYKVESFDEKSEIMKNKFQDLFVNFIKGGNPNPDNRIDCEWPQSKTHKLSICHINLKCSVNVYNEEKDPSYNFWINEINNIKN